MVGGGWKGGGGGGGGGSKVDFPFPELYKGDNIFSEWRHNFDIRVHRNYLPCEHNRFP